MNLRADFYQNIWKHLKLLKNTWNHLVGGRKIICRGFLFFSSPDSHKPAWGLAFWAISIPGLFRFFDLWARFLWGL